MWDWSGHMNGWWWMVPVILVFWALLVWGFVTLLRTRGESTEREAKDVLAERFARGEIDEAEYRHRREVIRS